VSAVPWGKVFDSVPAGLSDEERLCFDAVDLLVPAAHLQYARICDAAVTTDALEERMAATADPIGRHEVAQSLSARVQLDSRRRSTALPTA
jgi:hypothetical protein